MSTVFYILLGLSITLVSYFLITWGLSSVYFLVSHESLDIWRVIRISVSLAGVGLASTVLGMIVGSSLNIFILASLTAIIGFGAHFVTLKYLWKFRNFDSVIIAATLAIMLNPAWLHLIGVV